MSDVAYFDNDAARRCRALGHAFIRDFRHPNGEFEVQESDDCFRCGVSVLVAESIRAQDELASAPRS